MIKINSTSTQFFSVWIFYFGKTVHFLSAEWYVILYTDISFCLCSSDQ